MSAELYDIAEQQFDAARELAASSGLTLECGSDGCYQIRGGDPKWIINYYPRSKGRSPRVYHDRHHRGPFLKLPQMPTLMDFVNAALDAAKEKR